MKNFVKDIVLHSSVFILEYVLVDQSALETRLRCESFQWVWINVN